MSMTYSSYVTSIANLMPVPETDQGFITVLPDMIADCEKRLYRALDLIDASQRDYASSFAAGNRNFNLPSTNGTFIIVDEINAITPASSTTADGGTRNPLIPCSEEMLNALWPSVTGSTVPQYFAMVNQDLIIVGPWPDQTYRVEVVGMVRPAALSSTNVTTTLTEFFPDLMIAGSMVFVSAYMKNFGQAVDDPKAGVTWEQHYMSLLKDAKEEENRKQFTMAGWSDKSNTPNATPPRT